MSESDFFRYDPYAGQNIERLRMLEAQFAQLQSMPMQQGVVVRITGSELGSPNRFITVSCAQGLLDFERKGSFDVAYGDTVRLVTTPHGIGILDRTPSSGVPLGVSAVVSNLFPNEIAEVDAPGLGSRTVYYSLKCTPSLRVGSKVILDQHGRAILHADSSAARSQFAFEEDTNIRWDDIGGQDTAKRLLREAIEISMRHSALYKGYAKKPIKGVLIVGPPGCGKTMLAKATATARNDLYGVKAVGGFFYVKGPALVDKFVGVGEAKVRELFAAARDFEKRTGIPAIIFLDEVDAIASQRGDAVFTQIERKIVPALIAEMDGLEHSSSLVIAASNRPKQLDAAFVRSGRMNYTVHVDRPNEQVVSQILALNLHKTLVAGNAQAFANEISSYVFDDRHDIAVHTTPVGPIALKLKHLLNGAMVADIVEKASSLAMHRDIDEKKSSATGVTMSDLRTAVDQTVTEERVKSQDDVLAELVNRTMMNKEKKEQ